MAIVIVHSGSSSVGVTVDLLLSLAEGGASSGYRRRSGRWLVWFVAIVQGGSWSLGFSVDGMAVLSLLDSGHCHCSVVQLFHHWGHLQLVAVSIVVSRSGDDGHWWWWPLPLFGMVVVVAVVCTSGDGGASDGGNSRREGTYKFFESM